VSATWTTFFFEAANFIVLAAVLSWLFFRPVRGFIEERKAHLESARLEAERLRKQAEHELAEAKKLHDEAQASIARMRAEFRAQTAEEQRRSLEASHQLAERQRTELEQEMANRRSEQQGEVTAAVARAAGALTRQLLARIQGPELSQALFTAALPEVRRLRENGRLESLRVEVAEPLTERQLEQLAEAAGVPLERIEPRSVPSLGAGIRVLSQQGLVDGSIEGLAAFATAQLRDALED